MWLTFSCRAICGTSTLLPLNWNEVLRAITPSAEILLRSVMMSSVIPSLKYSCSGSPLMFVKGKMAIEGLLVMALAAAGTTRGAPETR